MNITELINTRYTTKTYNSQKKVTQEQLNILEEVLQKSPSSINSQPWKFIIIEDQKMKDKLSDASYFNKQKVLDSSHLIVFSSINNLSYFEQQINTYLPEGAVNYYNNLVKPLPEENIKSWLNNQVYIALGMLLSACASLGIDSTPMEGIEKDKYSEILGLENHGALFAVAIGYRDPSDKNQPTITPKNRIPKEEVIVHI